jgi:anti-anti-sigma factor
VIESMLCAMDGPPETGSCCPLFEISQRHEADGSLRATLLGELDLSGAARLRARLAQLQRSRRRVRLDLSKLKFIDCSGIGAILSALAEARRDGGEIEIDRLVSPNVSRLIGLMDIGAALWPEASVAVAAAPGPLPAAV